MNSFLRFEVSKHPMGIDIHCVKEVLDNINLQPVPVAPPFVLGLLNRRGKIFSIINLAVLLGLPAQERYPESRIVILEHKGVDVGILVDTIKQATSVCSPSSVGKKINQFKDMENITCNFVHKDEEGLFLVDIEKFFTFLTEGAF
jgi:purine-binding chemotaxis protein CheW